MTLALGLGPGGARRGAGGRRRRPAPCSTRSSAPWRRRPDPAGPGQARRGPRRLHHGPAVLADYAAALKRPGPADRRRRHRPWSGWSPPPWPSTSTRRWRRWPSGIGLRADGLRGPAGPPGLAGRPRPSTSSPRRWIIALGRAAQPAAHRPAATSACCPGPPAWTSGASPPSRICERPWLGWGLDASRDFAPPSRCTPTTWPCSSGSELGAVGATLARPVLRSGWPARSTGLEAADRWAAAAACAPGLGLPDHRGA